jgi:hypothetical protein|tara:strand:+ start:102 stop:440 length:339 start_codon:yes stop_codon:yes gene_type:complete
MEKIEYIYESPDGGKTVTRRKFGESVKELIQSPEEVIEDLFDGEPAVSTLTEQQIEHKFGTLRTALKSVRLRANWTQDYTMSHKVNELVDLLEDLERDVITASETAKNTIKY